MEEKISAYLTWLERNPSKQGQLLLSFYETRRKQAWFAAHEERLYWEQWYVHVVEFGACQPATRCIPLSLLAGSCPPSPRLATSPSSVASEGARCCLQYGFGGTVHTTVIHNSYVINNTYVATQLHMTATRVQRQAKLQSGLQESLTTIVRLVNEKRDHIPPVVSSSPLTFPFDITIVGYASFLLASTSVCCCRRCDTCVFMTYIFRDAASGFGLDTFRRMLTQMQTTPPPMLS